jgi:hypothetical protein
MVGATPVTPTDGAAPPKGSSDVEAKTRTTSVPDGAPVDSHDARRRGAVEIRWRQFRRAPRPIVRAVLSSLIVALILAVAFVAYDLALTRGVPLPGGDLRTLFLAVYVALVLLIGSVATYLLVPQPSGSRAAGRRSAWSAALGFFAAVPIAYLVMIVAVQVVRPLLG